MWRQPTMMGWLESWIHRRFILDGTAWRGVIAYEPAVVVASCLFCMLPFVIAGDWALLARNLVPSDDRRSILGVGSAEVYQASGGVASSCRT